MLSAGLGKVTAVTDTICFDLCIFLPPFLFFIYIGRKYQFWGLHGVHPQNCPSQVYFIANQLCTWLDRKHLGSVFTGGEAWWCLASLCVAAPVSPVSFCEPAEPQAPAFAFLVKSWSPSRAGHGVKGTGSTAGYMQENDSAAHSWLEDPRQVL